MITPSVALALRALRLTLRRPQFLIPLFLMPSIFLAVNTGGLSATTRLPGFPETTGFLAFQLAAAMVQSLMLSGLQAGIAVSLEIESGFFDRIVTAPVPRLAIVAGRLMAAAVLGAGQVLFFLIVGVIFGADLAGGVVGALVVVVLGALAGVAFAAIGLAIAFRARQASIVQGLFPFVFAVLYLSSAFFPQELLGPPADTISAFNPLSYIAEGLRAPIAYGMDALPILEGLAMTVAVIVVASLLAVAGLRWRLADAA
ncbi:MAG: ABC transporter permease [Solirubrobacteraceae bacterium]|nr:ABC transporter permease [Solirubrobacteraceae bacterium]